ncbi:mannose-1-phosphate guanylyltransferase/mannose-6-phosphate isomerase [Ketobacter sp. MCCC 1A13808]|uniref:mannose-1-phosphate guanylyltransferase/mannose-6-phosphate isomerase n=1 Tax=Ketobacter sp. MCCC 1A13808 TaxID=2602738 RepID=UPI000F0F2F32|nr:mannose-1-phosphate guanylyltransferase/mannose-6-phosphate isomerase [Ketobacter sp. MCCC 1A13808]MVF12939.1 mannose-1-phosphate guanylyltransferase/mannose-6-phosphate isomerase [Ketobacter sp. MCCC 1A13808]RLP54396.1 MAG: mannose-1-phosphate guanylyltransferase/mannose-6-phosphate isomerase [Ketobacter sp.]
MIPVVLSGGSGSRLWPLSRSSHPKQFLPLCSDQSMVQETLTRLSRSVASQSPIFVTAEDQRFLLAEQIRSLGVSDSRIILEPARRNTAPAIALACLCALEQDPEAVVLVLPSDHHIKDQPAFHEALALANAAALEGKLVTFGIVPSKPETGYGYIKVGNQKSGPSRPIAAFVEKPDFETAKQYVADDHYYWNSGMFAFRADLYLSELAKFNPDMIAACRAAWQNKSLDLDFVRIGTDDFLKSPEDSIDYAVMEKTDKGVVIPLDAGWSDVGSWQSLWEVKEGDEFGNVFEGDVLALDTENSMAISQSRLVSLLGVKNIAVIETRDAVLVADIDQVQRVKNIVKTIEESGRTEHEFHREVHRPWGKFDSVDAGGRYQVKRITVKPGARLSTQLHHHRAEHWVVVQGTAKVRRGDETVMISENESVYIPLGEVHSLENPGKIMLEIIEIQTGAYLGEDDIIRLDDTYGRGNND